MPFQVSGKYQASVVNSYFDILIAYGDQYQVLNFRDLIDVKERSETDISVELKNPEYAITSAIRKVLLSYQGSGGVFDTLHQPVTFTGYLSASDALPEPLQKARAALEARSAKSATSPAESSRYPCRTLIPMRRSPPNCRRNSASGPLR